MIDKIKNLDELFDTKAQKYNFDEISWGDAQKKKDKQTNKGNEESAELILNFSPEDEKIIKKYAKMEGKSVSNFIKDIFLEKIKGENLN